MSMTLFRRSYALLLTVRLINSSYQLAVNRKFAHRHTWLVSRSQTQPRSKVRPVGPCSLKKDDPMNGLQAIYSRDVPTTGTTNIYQFSFQHWKGHECLTLAFTKSQDRSVYWTCATLIWLWVGLMASYVLVLETILLHRQQTDVIYVNLLTPRLYKFGKG